MARPASSGRSTSKESPEADLHWDLEQGYSPPNGKTRIVWKVNLDEVQQGLERSEEKRSLGSQAVGPTEEEDGKNDEDDGIEALMQARKSSSMQARKSCSMQARPSLKLNDEAPAGPGGGPRPPRPVFPA